MTLPAHIIQWLQDRGITTEVINEAGLGWNGTHLVIPIRDLEGKVIFNKYRRDPHAEDDGQPKYKYDPGTTAQLFNAHKLNTKHSVIICEGELDALRLESAGYLAVTGTGGSSTFRDEWIELLKDKDVYVCYDNDEAGIKGAVKVLTKLPAKMVYVPPLYGAKDVTDYLKNGGSFSLLLDQAVAFPVLSEPVPEFKGIGDREEWIKKYRRAIDEISPRVRQAKNNKQPFHHLEAVIHILNVAIQNLERGIRWTRIQNRPLDPEGMITDVDVQAAKQIPIETLYTGVLKTQGYKAVGKCPFHEEDTPSFTIYLNQNKFFCYGCQAGTDAIDYIKRRDNCDFITAVKTLLNK